MAILLVMAITVFSNNIPGDYGRPSRKRYWKPWAIPLATGVSRSTRNR